MISRRDKGQKGEDRASAYLKSRGFSILERNFTSPMGEIDIIALKDRRLIFVEVRARHSMSRGTPAQSITIFKKRRIVKTAQFYIKCHMHYAQMPIRFDFIGIENDKLSHIENFISEDELY